MSVSRSTTGSKNDREKMQKQKKTKKKNTNKTKQFNLREKIQAKECEMEIPSS